MEVVEGRSLAAELRRTSPMSVRCAAEIAAQSESGLSAAHSASVISRDGNPTNPLVTAAWVHTIAAFCIAKFRRRRCRPDGTRSRSG